MAGCVVAQKLVAEKMNLCIRMPMKISIIPATADTRTFP